MVRKKKSSPVVEKAEQRLAGTLSISSSLDLGSGLTVNEFVNRIDTARAKVLEYNTVLSSVDKAYSEMKVAEQALADFTEQMLLGVATRYGKRSDEYEMAGGKRKGGTKRTARSAATSQTAPVANPSANQG